MRVSSLCFFQMEESACNLQCRYICCLMFSKWLSINLRGEQENLF